MQRLKAVELSNAEGKSKEILDSIQKSRGKVPNLFKIMANSPASLVALTGFLKSMHGCVLPAKLQEKIALYVFELNNCNYCLSAHTLRAKKLGLSEEEMESARRGASSDVKEDAAIKFAGSIIAKRANMSDDDVSCLKDAGYSDAEIVEIIANVSLFIFTSYFNNIAETEIDFPPVKPLT